MVMNRCFYIKIFISPILFVCCVLIYFIDCFVSFRALKKTLLIGLYIDGNIRLHTWVHTFPIYKNICRIYYILLGRAFLASGLSYFVLLHYCTSPGFQTRTKPFSLPHFPSFSWYILPSYTGQMLHRDAYKCEPADEAIPFYEWTLDRLLWFTFRQKTLM